MGISQYDPAARGRPAWNAGRQIGAKRALKPRQIWAIRFFLDREGRMRDRALFDLAIDSKLRVCDLLKIKIGTLVAGPSIWAAQWLSSRRPAGRSSSRSHQMRGPVFWHGSRDVSERWMTTPFQVALTPAAI
jgi:hypothetical protein